MTHCIIFPLVVVFLTLILSIGRKSKPDYEAISDRALSFPEMGRQSDAGKAIDAFIRELSLGER
ncbi:hypothetical protein [Nostoc sp. WHI]|uniref:hypothetical protein n=1 Tax=Nostoc sp. WHI TaxID=2650611 RepID=UPI0018C69D0C|nr:hypothetical protein [Nostoc sp. WHI]MBG1266957.1 hypothetical protein [Nostoc sp. WHI]